MQDSGAFRCDNCGKMINGKLLGEAEAMCPRCKKILIGIYSHILKKVVIITKE